VALATTGDSTGRSPSTAPSTYPAPRVTVAAIYYGASFSSPASAELVVRSHAYLLPPTPPVRTKAPTFPTAPTRHTGAQGSLH